MSGSPGNGSVREPRSKTAEACEASLLRPKTYRLDWYLLHWRGKHPLGEAIAAFEELQENGKILP